MTMINISMFPSACRMPRLLSHNMNDVFKNACHFNDFFLSLTLLFLHPSIHPREGRQSERKRKCFKIMDGSMPCDVGKRNNSRSVSQLIVVIVLNFHNKKEGKGKIAYVSPFFQFTKLPILNITQQKTQRNTFLKVVVSIKTMRNERLYVCNKILMPELCLVRKISFYLSHQHTSVLLMHIF